MGFGGDGDRGDLADLGAPGTGGGPGSSPSGSGGFGGGPGGGPSPGPDTVGGHPDMPGAKSGDVLGGGPGGGPSPGPDTVGGHPDMPGARSGNVQGDLGSREGRSREGTGPAPGTTAAFDQSLVDRTLADIKAAREAGSRRGRAVGAGVGALSGIPGVSTGFGLVGGPIGGFIGEQIGRSRANRDPNIVGHEREALGLDPGGQYGGSSSVGPGQDPGVPGDPGGSYADLEDPGLVGLNALRQQGYGHDPRVLVSAGLAPNFAALGPNMNLDELRRYRLAMERGMTR